MSQTFKTLADGDITRKALSILHNKLPFIKSINRQYDDRFAKTGAKNAGTLLIREPNQFVTRSGATMDAQDITEQTQTLTMATQHGVDINFSSVELTLSLDDFADRILTPAMAKLAAKVESTVISAVYKNVYKFTNTTHGTPPVLTDLLAARAKLSQGLAPRSDRNLLVDALSANSIITAGSTLFHAASEIEKQYSEGMVGRIAGFDLYESEMVPTHTNGSRIDTTPTTPTANMTNAVTSILVSSGTSGDTYNAGDIFTVDGIYACNPETKAAYAHLQQFVVTSAATYNGSTVLTLYIAPTIYISGALTSVVVVTSSATASVSNLDNGTNSGAASATYWQNLAYHKDAFTFVTADLEMPQGGAKGAREVYDGISLRYIRGYDIINDKHPARFDILYGYKTIRPMWACRVGGKGV